MSFDLRQAQEILAATPGTLRALLGNLSAQWLRCDEGPETFSPRDVVGHLLFGERTDWMARVQRILDDGEETPFDPFDRRGHEGNIAELSLKQVLNEFEQARKNNLADLTALNLQPSDLQRRGTHPALGPVTLGQLLATWVVHDLGHIRQITRVMAGRHREAVGPWRAYLPVLNEGPGADAR